MSNREIEVLALVAKGNSNKEIGRHLHISEATVKTHLVHIFDKLGVTDRTAAVIQVGSFVSKENARRSINGRLALR